MAKARGRITVGFKSGQTVELLSEATPTAAFKKQAKQIVEAHTGDLTLNNEFKFLYTEASEVAFIIVETIE